MFYSIPFFDSFLCTPGVSRKFICKFLFVGWNSICYQYFVFTIKLLLTCIRASFIATCSLPAIISSFPLIFIYFYFWGVPSCLYIPKIITFCNIKHYPLLFSTISNLLLKINGSHHLTYFSSNFTLFLHFSLVFVSQPNVYKWLGQREYILDSYRNIYS